MRGDFSREQHSYRPAVRERRPLPGGSPNHLPRGVAILYILLLLVSGLSAQTVLLGNQTVQSNLDSEAAGSAAAFTFTASGTGQVDSINFFLDETSASTNVYVGIYSDASGKPGNLLTQGNSTTLDHGTWNTVSIPVATLNSGTPYWIAILGATGGKTYFYDEKSTTCKSRASTATNLTSLPGTWGKGKSRDNCSISAYAVTSPVSATVMIGDEVVEKTIVKNRAKQARAFPAVANTTGLLGSIQLYLDPTSGSGPVYLGFYEDSGSDHPGTLLSQGSTTSPQPGAWNSISLTPVSITAGTRYWIAILGTLSTGPYVHDRATTECKSETSKQTNLTSLPSTWETGTLSNTCFLSAYGLPGVSAILSISPSTFSFSAAQGGANPSPASLSVSNTGSGTLNFTVSTDQTWLSAAPSSGTAPESIQVSANVAGLTAGTYSGHVTVTATGAQNSPAVAAVTLTVGSFAPPTISAAISPAPDSYSWNNTPVTVSFNCTAGSYPIASCSSPVLLSAQGANQQVTGTVTDTAGNTASVTASVNIDLTPPTISASVSPLPNGNGWVIAPATVTFTCADVLSGVASCPSPQVINTLGANQSVTGTVTNKAGSTASTGITLNVGSLTPPTIASTVSGSPNAAGWYNKPVTITYSCSAPGGIPVTCPPNAQITNDGANQVITGTATDPLGVSASVSNTINLDQTPPVISITSNTTGQTVLTTNITLSGVVTDATSGVASVTCDGQIVTLTGSGFSCNLTLQLGSNTVTVQATDIAGNVATSTLTLQVATPISVTITSPQSQALFSANPITVTGTVSAPNCTVVVNGVTASVSGTNFTASGVTLREALNLLTAAASNASGGVGSATVSVYLDATPPTVSITSPSNGAVLTSSQVSVSGNVNDLVNGILNSTQVQVSVNGVQASVANRSFMAQNVVLVPGSNVITATATDQAGNSSTNQVTVTLQQTTGQQTINMISGNNQTGAINSVLPQPLVAQAVDAYGQPIAGRQLTFAVTESDGILIGPSSQGQQLTVVTDANGNATAQFQLGSRNGPGVNQVTVSGAGFVNQTVFMETSNVGTATQIHTVSGEMQTGAVGQPLAQPFAAIVADASSNPVAGVPVTFTVLAGGGIFSQSQNQNSITVNTDTDGKAYALLTLASQEGVNNNQVNATFTGMTGAPATFFASGVTPSGAGQTSVAGLVLDDTDVPVPNATISIEGTNLSTTTNSQGQFTITGAPIGQIVLFVDGSTSTSTETLPTLDFQMANVPGIVNTLGHPIYLPAIDTTNSYVVGGNQPLQLTMSGVPGLVYTVAPNSVTFPDGSHVGTVTLSQVHTDKVPMIPPNGTAPRLVGTLQPAGISFNPPIQMQLPNTDGLAPGQVTEIFSFHHDVEQFVVEGTARVSADGSTIVSDPGFGLTVSGWHGGGGTSQPTSCGDGCPTGDPCGSWACVNNACQFTISDPNLVTEVCGQTACGTKSCTLNNGCVPDVPNDGAACNSSDFCVQPGSGSCDQNGNCNGDQKPPINQNTQSISFGLGKAMPYLTQILREYFSGQIPLPPTISFSGSDQTSQTCCSAQQSYVNSEQLSAGGAVQADLNNIPAIFTPIPGVGLFLNANIGGSGTLSGTQNDCTPTQTLWKLTLQITLGGGLVAGVLPGNNVVSVEGSGNVSVSMGFAGQSTLNSVVTVYPLATFNGVTLTLKATLLGGTYTAYNGTIIPMQQINLPQFQCDLSNFVGGCI